MGAIDVFMAIHSLAWGQIELQCTQSCQRHSKKQQAYFSGPVMSNGYSNWELTLG